MPPLLFAPQWSATPIQTVSPPADGSARLRFVNASPDTAAVDVFVEGHLALPGLLYAHASAYLMAGGNQREITLFAAGETTPLVSMAPFLLAGTDYTYILSGFSGNLARAPLQVTLLHDTGEGDGLLRVVHAAPSVPAADLWATAPFPALTKWKAAISDLRWGADTGYYHPPTEDDSCWAALGVPQSSPGPRTIITLDARGGGAPLGTLILSDRN